MLYLRKSEQDQSGSGLQRQDDLHLQLSMNSDETPIRDHILVFSRFDEAIVDVEHRRDAHLMAPVCLVLLEGAIPVLRIRKISEGDAGTCTVLVGILC